MRCPNCGTENAPDSRFCGGCGMQQAQQQHMMAQQQRLAPTAKIPDDAPLAPPTRSVAPITPVAGVSYSPPSMPPQPAPGLAPPGQAGLTTRPGGHSAPPRVSGETPQVRASQQYGQVQPRKPSQAFDSVTPTSQQRRPTPQPIPQTPYPAGSEPPQQRRPQASNASMSLENAATHRPLGLIAFVLIVDLGLAGAGAFLLAKGLAKPEPAKGEQATPGQKSGQATPDKKSELPGTAANAVTSVVSAAPTAPPVTTAPAASAPSATSASVAARTNRASSGTSSSASAPPSTTRGAASTSTTRGAASTSAASGAPSGPVTSPSSVSGVVPVTSVPTTTTTAPTPPPPAAQPPSTASQIDDVARRSAGAFARCTGDAAVAGSIEVAFHVNPDGTVSNAFAVENTTGSAELGNCLARVISGWRVSPFQGARMSFVRPFSYP